MPYPILIHKKGGWNLGREFILYHWVGKRVSSYFKI